MKKKIVAHNMHMHRWCRHAALPPVTGRAHSIVGEFPARSSVRPMRNQVVCCMLCSRHAIRLCCCRTQNNATFVGAHIVNTSSSDDDAMPTRIRHIAPSHPPPARSVSICLSVSRQPAAVVVVQLQSRAVPEGLGKYLAFVRFASKAVWR